MFCRRKYYRNMQNGDITIEEVEKKILEGAILIDVRSYQEYREGHIQGAINIPDYEVVSRIQKVIPQKNQLIVTYCQYGGRSRNVMKVMKKMGYTNAYNLYGGLENL